VSVRDAKDCVRSVESVRRELIARVRARQRELEETIFVRVRDTVYSTVGNDDAEYVAGLRMAVVAAVEHGISGIELGEADGAGSIPSGAMNQARRAARAGVSLDTVLRRYVLGSTLLGDFLMQEADYVDFAGHAGMLRDLLNTQAAVLDRLMSAVIGEYELEIEQVGRSPDRRRAEHVQRLLTGTTGDTADLGYDVDGWHLGVIAIGPTAGETLRHCAEELGVPLLCVCRGEDTVWGWLGGHRPRVLHDFERVLGSGKNDASFVTGEPAPGIAGWRLTHQQAQAALRVALFSPRPLTRYADVALLASVLRDDTLAGSMVEMYLAPLGDRENGGGVLRKTLRAYFAAERNASSAASALGVARHTVQNRLRIIEEKLGQGFRTRQAELEVALRLDELGEGLG
jgi:PucR C-terminal helix-turn-helix domain/GGDEF-like domain